MGFLVFCVGCVCCRVVCGIEFAVFVCLLCRGGCFLVLLGLGGCFNLIVLC